MAELGAIDLTDLDRTATLELVGRSPISDDVVRAIDYFTVDDSGKITELRVEFL